MNDITDYVITHRDWPIVQDDLYRALCVGGFRKDGWLCAADGENIEQYNDRLNELTGLYWIWKNTDIEYVGLSHYRRYFDNGGRLDEAAIRWLLQDVKYDIILSRIRLPWSVHHNICMTCGGETARAAYDAFLETIRERQPEYAEAFEDVMCGSEMYRCNMFVTRREIMDRFCGWLFSFLTEAADKVDVSGLGFYGKRVCGYVGEAMWTVWLKRHRLNVYDMWIG